MNKWTWILLFAVFTIALIVNAPASILSGIISNSSKGRVALANTQGTLWHGSANPILHQHSGEMIVLNTVHWNLAARSLLKGKLEIQINWDDNSQVTPMRIIVSAGSIELRHVYIPLPAMLLEEVTDFLKPAQLRGQVILRGESLLLTQQDIQGEAAADWLNASSLLSDITPLGNYHFTFSSSPSGLDITLSTTTGVLLLAGKGHFTAATGLSFKGSAQAASGKAGALRELLSYLGPEERPGINTFTLVPSRVHK